MWGASCCAFLPEFYNFQVFCLGFQSSLSWYLWMARASFASECPSNFSQNYFLQILSVSVVVTLSGATLAILMQKGRKRDFIGFQFQRLDIVCYGRNLITEGIHGGRSKKAGLGHRSNHGCRASKNKTAKGSRAEPPKLKTHHFLWCVSLWQGFTSKGCYDLPKH